jgi:hypothetical protein
MRYLELIYNNKSFKSETQIDLILEQNKLNWLIDSEIEMARLEIINSTIIWHEGTFFSGDWHYGIFKGGKFWGNWRNGIFENGQFLGKWHSGINLINE